MISTGDGYVRCNSGQQVLFSRSLLEAARGSTALHET